MHGYNLIDFNHIRAIDKNSENRFLFSFNVYGHRFPAELNEARALSYDNELILLQSFQPMGAQLSKKAALPLAKTLSRA